MTQVTRQSARCWCQTRPGSWSSATSLSRCLSISTGGAMCCEGVLSERLVGHPAVHLRPNYPRTYTRRGGLYRGGWEHSDREGALVWPDEPVGWKNVDEYPDSEKRDPVWGIFERISKLTEADALKLGAIKGPYDKIPFFRFDEEAAAEFLAWRGGLQVRLRGDSLSPALEGHLAKYRKLVPALALIDLLAEGGNGGVGKEALLRALAMAEYLETHARRLYGATDTIDIIAAEAILAQIRRGAL